MGVSHLKHVSEFRSMSSSTGRLDLQLLSVLLHDTNLLPSQQLPFHDLDVIESTGTHLSSHKLALGSLSMDDALKHPYIWR